MHSHQVPSEIIALGSQGENPSNFEQMFRWWQRVWKQQIKPEPEQKILLCLKGCVAQTAEAGRISGLSGYGERIEFFDFVQDTEINRKGIPSSYTGPILGTNYLWDRTQQQALRLLDRFDYAGVEELLMPYFKQDTTGFSRLPTLIKAGIAWNQGEFQAFFNRAAQVLTASEQKREHKYWWMAYEQAQMSVVRLQQQNTTEAMLSSFRSVEGLLWLWAKATFPDDVEALPDKYPVLKKSICGRYSKLQSQIDFNRNENYPNTVLLQGHVIKYLLEAAITETATSTDFNEFWSTARIKRNNHSHRLGGLPEVEVFKAWGQDIRNQAEWETRILNCLNLITGQPFKSLTKASLFCVVHTHVKQAIVAYETQA